MSQAAKRARRRSNYYYDVGTLDYAKMEEAMRPLVALMKKTDKVRIAGSGTDLQFSIKGINVIPCAGEMNIPDGEVFTAPVRDSINGTLSYNTPTQYLGTVFEKIVFEFKDGKIVKATSSDDKKINDILNTDEGARFIGEFAIGVNPYITKPMLDTLFEKDHRQLPFYARRVL
jgi:aminopeptidase